MYSALEGDSREMAVDVKFDVKFDVKLQCRRLQHKPGFLTDG